MLLWHHTQGPFVQKYLMHERKSQALVFLSRPGKASGVGSEGLLTSMGVGSEGLAESYLAAVHLKMELEGTLAGSVVKPRLGVLKACVGLAGVPGSPDC